MGPGCRSVTRLWWLGWAQLHAVVTLKFSVWVQQRLWGDKQRSLYTFYIMTNTYCKTRLLPNVWVAGSEINSYTSPWVACTSFTHYHFPPWSEIKSEKAQCTHTHGYTHMYAQHTAWVLYWEGLRIGSHFLSPDKLINTINSLIYTLGLKFDTRTLSWLRKHKWFCARGFNDRSVI